MRLVIQPDRFDLGKLSNDFVKNTADIGAGAAVTFVGTVRDNGGHIKEMEIEHYPAMTQKAITTIMQEASLRWGLLDLLVVHRHGRLLSHEVIVIVATAAKHRADAFQAADFVMDYLKSRAPFWKKEITSAGAEWVSAKEADEIALKRWVSK